MEATREPVHMAVGNTSPTTAELSSDSFLIKEAMASARPEIATADLETESGIQPFVDHERENIYWRENYRRRPYFRPDRVYFDYQPAFRYGWESAARSEYRGKTFEEAEKDLARGWVGKGITWKESREAVRDAWDRVRDGH